jgi:excisionase family DNA binding protein
MPRANKERGGKILNHVHEKTSATHLYTQTLIFRFWSFWRIFNNLAQFCALLSTHRVWETSGNGVPTVAIEWLTANEVAQYLKVQPRTVLKWAKERRIPAHPLSGSKRVTWRFLKSELDAMLSPPSAAGDGGLNAGQQN